MRDIKELYENLKEFIELFIKILHEEGPGLPGCTSKGVREIICFLNWYNEHSGDWPKNMRLSKKDYNKIIQSISIALEMPEKVIKNINYETYRYYNLDNCNCLFIPEIYVFYEKEECKNTNRTKYMIEQYVARNKIE